MPTESESKQKAVEHLNACPVRGIIDVISKKWAFLIINALGNGGRLRFNGLMGQLEGVSPKTLSDTLKILEKERLVHKQSFNEIPRRVEYSLTKDGNELRKAIMPLLRWATRRDGAISKKCALRCQDGPEKSQNPTDPSAENNDEKEHESVDTCIRSESVAMETGNGSSSCATSKTSVRIVECRVVSN